MLDTEVELKLGTDLAGLEALMTAPALRRNARGRPVRRQLESVYFDTDDLRLRRRGLALRVRRIGRGYIQTLKAEGDGTGGLLRRGEWEAAIASPEPQPEAIDAPELRARLGVLFPEALRPVFTTRIRRETRVVELTDGAGRPAVVEIAFDQGVVVAGEAERPIVEVELELVQGAPAALYQLALTLHDLVPVRVETRSKSLRGYLLATGEAPPWSKAARLRLDADATVDDALALVLRSCLQHWTANEAAARGGQDVEGVHQLRVALRRLRSALVMFREVIPEDHLAWLQAETRWLAGGLAGARDWDVFTTELLAPLQAARPEDTDLSALAEAVRAERLQGQEEARATLDAPRYTTLLLRLGLWLESRGWHRTEGEAAEAALERPARELADALLERRHRRLLRDGEGFAGQGAAERHQLRITGKKLRYTTEFFASLYRKKRVRRWLEALTRLQDDLGHLNDVAVAERLLHALLEARGQGRKSRPLARAAGLVVGWYAHRLAAGEAATVAHWDKLAAARPFWGEEG